MLAPGGCVAFAMCTELLVLTGTSSFVEFQTQSLKARSLSTHTVSTRFCDTHNPLLNSKFFAAGISKRSAHIKLPAIHRRRTGHFHTPPPIVPGHRRSPFSPAKLLDAQRLARLLKTTPDSTVTDGCRRREAHAFARFITTRREYPCHSPTHWSHRPNGERISCFQSNFTSSQVRPRRLPHEISAGRHARRV